MGTGDRHTPDPRDESARPAAPPVAEPIPLPSQTLKKEEKPDGSKHCNVDNFALVDQTIGNEHLATGQETGHRGHIIPKQPAQGISLTPA